MPSYRVLKTITCGFEPGEIRRADEFPDGFELSRLLATDSVRALDPIDVLPGKPVSVELLDQVEQLNESLAAVREHFEEKLAAKDQELTAEKARLAEARAELATVGDKLAAAQLAHEAEAADLKAKLAEARAAADKPKPGAKPRPDDKPKDPPPAGDKPK